MLRCDQPVQRFHSGLGHARVPAAPSREKKRLGETGIRILVRIMGLLLVALAMQFFVNGLTDLGVIAHQAPQ